MKKLTLIFVLFFLVILFLVTEASAFQVPQQIITGKFQVYDDSMMMGKMARISIVGSANISPSGSLEALNLIPGADQGEINDAFISLAESLDCTVGNPYEPPFDPMLPPVPGMTAISFVCEGAYKDVLKKTAYLLSFPLSLVADAGP